MRFKNIVLTLSIVLSFCSISHARDSVLDESLIEVYIAEFDISREEAIRRLDLINHSQSIIDEMQAKFGDDIVSIYFDNESEFRLVVRTTAQGRDLKEMRALAGTKNELPVLILKNNPRNAQAITNIIKNQSARLAKNIEGFSMMGYDPVKDRIIISIYEPNVDKQNMLKNDQSIKKISGIETEIEFLSQPLETLSLKGGAPINQRVQITPSITQLNNCTSAFPAIYNGQNGLLTAAHCADKTLQEKTPIIYKGYGNDPRTDMIIAFYDKNATTHDIMFITPRDSTQVSNLYYVDSVTQELVREYINPSVGIPACQHGQTTGKSCGVISQTYTHNNAKNACPASLKGMACEPAFAVVRGSSLRIKDGDSGGAVYSIRVNKNHPVGVTSSGAETELGGILVFSPLHNLNSTGIKLKTY
ncbi:trypsin-like serine protease [Moraxella canis]|uniref:Trypsin-like serine protease n=1 Tax=Moraxella canis TaxID=90239 RepID=A0ABZ0WZH9_9GAMM|nr:trypsin-like serine protease [Moraxella canis]WQE04647.1 trypsin-like serine protease [Moraxella canis]